MNPRKKLLIVDDDIAHRTMLRILLEWTYNVMEAENGAMAIETVKSHSIDLILMDVRMPKVSGTEALGKIKKLAPAIPVIMMSACSSKQMAAEAMKRGAYGWLEKPLDFDVLWSKIAEAVSIGINTHASPGQISD